MEMVEQAIIDARVNAADNNITNCTFVCGKAEDVLPGMLSGGISTQFDDHTELVAIVDPPRAGLHPKVLKVCFGVVLVGGLHLSPTVCHCICVHQYTHCIHTSVHTQ